MKNSSKTPAKHPKLSPLQEMKRFRRVYRRILKCRNAMRIAAEKKEKALTFAHDYRFYECIQLLIDEDDEKKRLAKENRERFQDPEKVKKEESFVMIDVPNLSKYAQEILENYDVDSCLHSYRECPKKEGLALKKSVDEEQTQLINDREPPF